MQKCEWNRSLSSASEISGIERTLLNFCISVVNSEFAKEEPNTAVLKILRLEGGSFQISIPLNLLAVD